MKKVLYSLIVIFLISSQAFSQSRNDFNPPLNFQAESPALTDYAELTWDEPLNADSVLGYNIYKDSLLIAFVNKPETVYYDLNLEPFIYNIYHVSAMYSGNPGGESVWVGPDTVRLIYCGCNLPFEELFSTGTFSTGNWRVEGDNWKIAEETGNSAPSAEFSSLPVVTNYSESLTSSWMNASSNPDYKILIEFDLKLSATAFTGTEKMNIELHDGYEWIPVGQIVNTDNLDWHKEKFDISDIARGIYFKIRFRAEGASTVNISNWLIDNVHVYEDAETKIKNLAPLSLVSEVYPNPAASLLNFTFKDQVGTIELYSITNKKLNTYFPAQGESQYKINVSHLQNGVYFIKLISNSGKAEVVKIIVQH
ncbi:MAG TPA: T9SS type A sorting domain-containing protein [Lentimicrobium sp.]|nr:T9SS type A sorting domain-containing protein [Lentimicrobium sp.]